MSQQPYLTRPNMDPLQNQVQGTNHKNFLWKGMLIGAFAGGLATLIDRNTRRDVQRRSVQLKDQTSNLYRTVREDPAIIMGTVKHTMDTTARALNDLAKEIRDVVTKVDEARDNSLETYSSYKGVGEEIKDVSGKVRQTGVELTSLNRETGGVEPTRFNRETSTELTNVNQNTSGLKPTNQTSAELTNLNQNTGAVKSTNQTGELPNLNQNTDVVKPTSQTSAELTSLTRNSDVKPTNQTNTNPKNTEI